ncbi:MAG: nucleotidyl transferase AbiEii/AbiGii toxin family protein, partial [Verrucomicrobia bacterium]|nr:nucleotidyl transferase AbiEii/AbiGii toxin family protein [Verrucomicrobiota bacterium]
MLPPSQAQLWPELSCIPQHFALYGGTAIALRLGHRPSVDFDFFSSRSFRPDELIETLPFLSRGERLQSKSNTLTVSVTRGAPIILSFFGGLALGRVGEPNQTEGNQVIVASLLDLAATKMAVIQERAEKKDYVDITRLIQAGIALETALGAAIALYGENFNPAISLKALAY